jgi:hypothetical protein
MYFNNIFMIKNRHMMIFYCFVIFIYILLELMVCSLKHNSN